MLSISEFPLYLGLENWDPLFWLLLAVDNSLRHLFKLWTQRLVELGCHVLSSGCVVLPCSKALPGLFLEVVSDEELGKELEVLSQSLSWAREVVVFVSTSLYLIHHCCLIHFEDAKLLRFQRPRWIIFLLLRWFLLGWKLLDDVKLLRIFFGADGLLDVDCCWRLGICLGGHGFCPNCERFLLNSPFLSLGDLVGLLSTLLYLLLLTRYNSLGLLIAN